MKKYVALTVPVLLTLIFTPPCFSQSAEEIKALREEIKSLKDGQKSIQKELREIKALLRPAEAPAEFRETVLTVKGKPSRGGADAKIALVEFSDFQ